MLGQIIIILIVGLGVILISLALYSGMQAEKERLRLVEVGRKIESDRWFEELRVNYPEIYSKIKRD
jgi:hypothetical protein